MLSAGVYKQILKSAQEYYVHSNVCSRFACEASHRNLLLKEFGVCASSGLPGLSGFGSFMLTYIVMTIWIVLFIKLPGCSPSYLVCDAAHRLVFLSGWLSA